MEDRLRIWHVELWSKRVAPENSELPVPSRGQVFSGDSEVLVVRQLWIRDKDTLVL